MRQFLAACALGMAMMCGAAFAQGFEAAFGNTITVTYADGATSRYYFNADGAFTATTPDGESFGGAWEITGAQICFDIPEHERACAPYEPGKQVGDTWRQPGTDGQEVALSIVAGR